MVQRFATVLAEEQPNIFGAGVLASGSMRVWVGCAIQVGWVGYIGSTSACIVVYPFSSITDGWAWGGGVG